MTTTHRRKQSSENRKPAALLFTFLVLLPNAATSPPGPIKTVVVLVMENRSFDHMLGWMKKLNPQINGVTGTESNPLSTTDPSSPLVFFKDEAQYIDFDPGHSFQAIREQIFGSNDTSASPPPMNGFAQQAFSMTNTTNMSFGVMSGFPSEMLAVYRSLVEEFAVFDRWFASVPGSTQPNRLYVHSATSHGATSNSPKLLTEGYPQRTIFENIEDSGLSFGIYFQNLPATLFYRNLRRLRYLDKFHLYDLEFKRDARRGVLPNYVVVEQRYLDLKVFPANDDHPSHDVYRGQMFVKEIYEALRGSPQWNETLFIVTYDEHGGFFDHVPTPVRDVPSPDGIVGPEPFFFNFDRLGVRVPTIMASPWIEKGTGFMMHNRISRSGHYNSCSWHVAETMYAITTDLSIDHASFMFSHMRYAATSTTYVGSVPYGITVSRILLRFRSAFSPLVHRETPAPPLSRASLARVQLIGGPTSEVPPVSTSTLVMEASTSIGGHHRVPRSLAGIVDALEHIMATLE